MAKFISAKINPREKWSKLQRPVALNQNPFLCWLERADFPLKEKTSYIIYPPPPPPQNLIFYPKKIFLILADYSGLAHSTKQISCSCSQKINFLRSLRKTHFLPKDTDLKKRFFTLV